MEHENVPKHVIRRTYKWKVDGGTNCIRHIEFYEDYSYKQMCDVFVKAFDNQKLPGCVSCEQKCYPIDALCLSLLTSEHSECEIVFSNDDYCVTESLINEVESSRKSDIVVAATQVSAPGVVKQPVANLAINRKRSVDVRDKPSSVVVQSDEPSPTPQKVEQVKKGANLFALLKRRKVA